MNWINRFFPESMPTQIKWAIVLLWLETLFGLFQSIDAHLKASSISDTDLLIFFAASAFGILINVMVYKQKRWAAIVYLLVTLLAGLGFIFTSLFETPFKDFEGLAGAFFNATVCYLLFNETGQAWFAKSPMATLNKQ
jgi:hypothetical protein